MLKGVFAVLIHCCWLVLRSFTKLLTDFFAAVRFWPCAGLRAFDWLGRLFESQLLPGRLRLGGLAVTLFGISCFFRPAGVSSGDLLFEARMIEERECRRQRFKIGAVWNFESPSWNFESPSRQGNQLESQGSAVSRGFFRQVRGAESYREV